MVLCTSFSGHSNTYHVSSQVDPITLLIATFYLGVSVTRTWVFTAHDFQSRKSTGVNANTDDGSILLIVSVGKCSTRMLGLVHLNELRHLLRIGHLSNSYSTPQTSWRHCTTRNVHYVILKYGTISILLAN